MPGEITQLLAELQAGDPHAESRLASLVYDELHRMADRCVRREAANPSFQATMLVHDAFLQLVNQEDRNWQNRSHFFAVAAQLMRRILVDYARTRKAAKRGGRQPRVALDENIVITDDNCEQVLAIDQALTRLAQRDSRLARVVELRFFAGMTEEEIAGILGISTRQVKRDWSVAKAWLHGELSGNDSDDGGPVATS
jgi:RNA polymerase sigma factor (TIGR02999 family)